MICTDVCKYKSKCMGTCLQDSLKAVEDLPFLFQCPPLAAFYSLSRSEHALSTELSTAVSRCLNKNAPSSKMS